VLVARWSRKDQPFAYLMHEVVLLGADQHFFKLYSDEFADDFISAKLTPTAESLQQCQADDKKFTPTDFSKYSGGIQDEPELADLLNEVAAIIPNQWYFVGAQLKMSHAELCSWRDSNPHASTELFAKIFTEWKKRSTMKYSWATIIEVLKTRTIHQFDLANRLDTKLKR